MREELRALIERHCVTIARSTAELATLLKRAPDNESLTPALAITHEIRGSSGSIGFINVSEAAAELELALKALDSESDGPGPWKRAIASLESLEHTTRALRPEHSRLYDSDLSAFQC